MMVSVQNISATLNTKLDFLNTWPYQVSFPICEIRPHWWELLCDAKEGAASIAEIPSVLHKAARSSWDLDFSAPRCTRYKAQRCSPSEAPQLHVALFTREL